MAQTPKPFATLIAEYADNDTKAIKPITHRNFVESALGCYGSMQVDGGSTAEALTAAPSRITGWLSVTAGTFKNTTPDAAADQITIGADGLWLVQFHATFLVVTAADRFKFELRNTDVLVPGFASEVNGLLGDRVQASFANVAALVANDELSVYASAIGAAGDATIEFAQLVATRVG